jgi:2'-5' RNA ligase
MKSTIRTFVAVEIEEVIRRAAKLVEELRAASADVTWVKPHNMHLTVKFLGDVTAEKIPHVCQTVARAVAGLTPFDLEIRGVGAFPNTARPRTIWLATGTGETQLADVAERIETALMDLGFAREGRPFRGHLTLGRVRRPGPALAELTRMLNERADLELGQATIREVVVFSSQLDRCGPIYEVLSRTPLAGG